MEDLTSGAAQPIDQQPLELEDLLVEALEALEAEGAPGLERLLARYPEEAERVRAHLDFALRMGLTGAPAAWQPAPERLGDFRILEALGQGAMGVVYRAVQESLGREVALKLVRPEQLYFGGARERFQREVQVVASLAHPGIVPVHAVGSADGVPYFAMELVRGATLAEVLEELAGRSPAEVSGADFELALARRLGEAPARELAPLFQGDGCALVARLLREVAETLEYVHRRGVLHRDVKPSNIMITRAGRVLLLDFGLAGTPEQERLTRTGSQIGSLAYMAPELLAGETQGLDARADVYALGATGWELCALRLPYSSSDPVRVRQLAATAQRPRLASLNPKVSWELETVLATALEPDRERRYASAAAMARDLDSVLGHRPISAREAGALLRLRRWGQRHPARATAGAALLLGLLIGPSLYALQEARARRTIEGQRDSLRETNVALELARDEARAESRRAQANFEALQRAVDTLLTRVGDETLRDVPRMERVRDELLTAALAFYEELREQAPDDPSLRVANAGLYARCAEVRVLLGEPAEAERELREALRLLELSAPATAVVAPQVARVRTRLAAVQRTRGELVAARATCEQALADWRGAGASEDSLELATGLVQARHERSLVLADMGDLVGAERELEGVLAELAERAGAVLPDAPLDTLHARALDRSAVLIVQRVFAAPRAPEAQARLALACQRHRLAGELWSRLLAAEGAPASLRIEAARNGVHEGIALQSAGRFEESLAAFERGVALCAALVQDFPSSPTRRLELASARTNLGTALSVLERWAEARAQYALARPLWEAACAASAVDDEAALGLAQVLQGEALAAWNLQQLEPAAELLSDSGLAAERALAVRPDNPTYRRLRAKVFESVAELELERGRHAAASEAARHLLDDALAPNDPALAAALLARCAPLAEADESLDEGERIDRADAYRDEALELFEAVRAAGRTRAELRADPALANQWSTPGVDELLELLPEDRQ